MTYKRATGKQTEWRRQCKRSTRGVGLAPRASAWIKFWLFGWLVIAGHSYGQTDFEINASSPDLETEYQKELDKWMLSAYEGDKDAQFKVGVLFSNDQFGEPDVEQASYWYTQAARQGHVLAQYNLGHQYLTGTGVRRDEKIAMQWWLKAAEQQHPLAQFNVGRAYYMGIGLDKDLSQAKLWFQRASQNKEPKSTELLKQLGWWDSDEVANVPPPSITTAAPTSDAAPQISSQPFESALNEETSQSAVSSTEVITEASTSEPSGTESMVLTQGGAPSEPSSVAANGVDSESLATAVTTASAPTVSSKEQINHSGKAVAIFTNPSVRSVLITIIKNAMDLKVLKRESSWSVVQSNEGFPVWVSKNFVRKNGAMGTITANSVNARSVPLLTKGSVVGRLEKNEKLTVLDQRGEWYRVRAPKRFKAWVKTDDLANAIPSTSPESARKTNNSKTVELSEEDQRLAIQKLAQTLGVSLNDNNWLFNQDEQRYALQLASFRNPDLVKQFVESLPLRDADDLRLFTTKSDKGGHWTYLVYGQFPDSDAAKLARTELKQKRAWVRRIGMLQQNRCIAWKKELPAPKELNEYCI